MALGDLSSAKGSLRESLENYPDFSLTHKTLGAIHQALGSKVEAAKSYQSAVELNPYDPSVQQALIDLYADLGDDKSSARHRRYLRILRRGGEDRELVVLHKRAGEVELPRDPRCFDEVGSARVEASRKGGTRTRPFAKWKITAA